MSDSGRVRRFRVDRIDVELGAEFDPGADVHRHLKVLRAAEHDQILVFDGEGREVRAAVVEMGADKVRVRVLEEVARDVESPLSICLVQAVPARVARMETIVRQVSELGVVRLLPVLSRRSQHAGAGLARKRERWQRIADGAAEQSGRTRLLSIDAPRAFDELDWDSLPHPLLVADPEADTGFDVVAVDRSVSIFVGPEGGWTADEVEVAREHGAIGVAAGPRVLRADTAGTVLATLAQYRWGDLGGR